MAFINKHDTNGTKGLLAKGELGYDDYAAGGDAGRVYVGTGTENRALAERLESNMMTKAQFNALAEERKANRAGSGFENFGKGSSTTTVNVNEGIWTDPTQINRFYLGKTTTNRGASTTSHAEIITNGVLQELKNVNSASALAEIQVPTAPTIYPHDTVLTTEQINSGVIKHADASNSGLIVNGKFDVDTGGWTAVKSTVTSVSGKLRVTLTDGDGGAYQFISTVIGKKYILELDTTFGTNTDISIRAYTGTFVTLLADKTTTVQGRHLLEFTATATSTMIHVMARNAIGKYCDFDNIAVYPADAISRSDLVFLESWHEDISEKNFVYPLGNVQYLGGNTDGLTGIANGEFTGFETYSLFGNWQTPSALIGKGYVWSNLTEAQKRAFISNPENNCYLDGDKIIQVRYRVRVVQGWGDSNSWIHTTNLTANTDSDAVRVASLQYVIGKGKSTSILGDIYGGGSGGDYFYLYGFGDSAKDIGTLSNTSTKTTYSGTSNHYMPIALVHRRNQGMYHNVYNPNGTKVASDGLDCFSTAVSFTSISDCFDPAKLLTASGYIGTVSGRPDGLFYDEVHQSDITDLRNSSKKVEDYNRLIGREFNKLVARTTRGFEGEKYTEITTQTTTGTVATVQVKYGTRYKRGDVIYIYDLTASSVKGRFVVISISTNTLTVDTAFAKLANSYMISGASSTRTKSNTLLVCDVIGNPSNYPAVWKNNEVTFTTLHTAEDDTSLLPDGTRDTFKLSRDANATPLLCLRSTDNGATWTSFTPTFSTTTNAITLTDEPAGNLVLVYYHTKTTMAVPTVNSEVLEIGEVLGTNGLANGALVSTLIGKVPTANTAPYSQRGYGVNGYRIDMSTFKFSTTSTELPVHSALSLAGGAIGVPAVKVLPYLTRKNGKAYLNLVFKEMKHNGTSWGDDNKFNIVDNVSTTTDQNAQNILYGTKEVEINMFVGADE